MAPSTGTKLTSCGAVGEARSQLISPRRIPSAATAASSRVSGSLERRSMVEATSASGCPAKSAHPRAPSALAAVSLAQPKAAPFPSTYRVPDAPATLIRNATLLTAAGPIIKGGAILIERGRITAIGTDVAAPAVWDMPRIRGLLSYWAASALCRLVQALT